jgi:GNAT superfamily N-acetyltransferase
MNNNFSLREADVKDAKLISELADAIWRKHYPSIISIEQIDYMLGSRYSEPHIQRIMQNGERFFLLYDEGNLQRLCLYWKSGQEDTYLHKFYVLVDRHRSGIGQALFTHLLQFTNPSKPIRLQVNRKNIKAINFYFKHGFTIEGAQDFDIGNGFLMEDFVMVRKSCIKKSIPFWGCFFLY